MVEFYDRLVSKYTGLRPMDPYYGVKQASYVQYQQDIPVPLSFNSQNFGQLVLENQKQAAGCSDREVEQVGLEKTCFLRLGWRLGWKKTSPLVWGENTTLSLVSGDYDRGGNLNLEL